MRARFFVLLENIRASYWFLPSLMTLGALGLGLAMIEVDRRLGDDFGRDIKWFYGGSAEGARSVLSTIAASMIGVAGVVFSITIVSLVLATNQFGPRLLRNFMRDRANQVVLGTFLATFLYCLTVLRVVYGDGVEQSASFIPHVSVTGGFILAIVSLGVLIFFIHHIAESIQVPHVIAAVNKDLYVAMNELFPEEIGRGDVDPQETRADLDRKVDELFRADAAAIKAPRGGYLQRVDAESLMQLACDHDLVILLRFRPGQYICRDDAVFKVQPGTRLNDKGRKKLARMIQMGPQRSLAQDILFIMNQLVEIAVRALSPGINDPFTAMQCLDRLGEGFSRLVGRKFPSPYRYDDEGRLRVIAYPLTFTDMLDSVFDMIRQYSQRPAVLMRMIETLGLILTQVRRDEDRVALVRQIETVHAQALEACDTERDRDELKECLAHALKNSRIE